MSRVAKGPGVLRLCCLVSATYSADCTFSELKGVLEHPEHPSGYATEHGMPYGLPVDLSLYKGFHSMYTCQPKLQLFSV